MISNLKQLSLTFFLCVSLVCCQQSPPPLEDILTPVGLPNPNQAFLLLFPASILVAQTPIAIRYVLVVTTAIYETQAACSPVSLSFLGRKESIPPRFCKSRLSISIIQSQLFYRLLVSEYPFEGRGYGRFLIENGLNPLDPSIDPETEIGWANAAANRLLKYFKSDGWNSQGDLTKTDYRAQYQDTSRYAPQNDVSLSPDQLRKPLRWQPLTGEGDKRGNFISQVHVTPHIGLRVKPLVLSQADFRQRKAPRLYSSPDRKNGVGKRDKEFVLRLIGKLFQRSRSTTAEKILRAFYWDNKFISLGSFIAFYEQTLGFSNAVNTQLLLGEVLAQYDALLVAWKEKRRWDNVRPPTVIRKLLKGSTVRAFKSLDEGVGVVQAEEWEPIVPIQPHSEYPSASALICAASFEQLQVGLQKLVLKANQTIPRYEQVLPPGALANSPVEETITVRYETLREADLDCGDSRLDAGVHFEPSVLVGRKLGKGIGKAAFEHVRDLIEGKTPKFCARCAH